MATSNWVKYNPYYHTDISLITFSKSKERKQTSLLVMPELTGVVNILSSADWPVGCTISEQLRYLTLAHNSCFITSDGYHHHRIVSVELSTMIRCAFS